jgi:hypothetical protein
VTVARRCGTAARSRQARSKDDVRVGMYDAMDPGMPQPHRHEIPFGRTPSVAFPWHGFGSRCCALPKRFLFDLDVDVANAAERAADDRAAGVSTTMGCRSPPRRVKEPVRPSCHATSVSTSGRTLGRRKGGSPLRGTALAHAKVRILSTNAGPHQTLSRLAGRTAAAAGNAIDCHLIVVSNEHIGAFDCSSR